MSKNVEKQKTTVKLLRKNLVSNLQITLLSEENKEVSSILILQKSFFALHIAKLQNSYLGTTFGFLRLIKWYSGSNLNIP